MLQAAAQAAVSGALHATQDEINKMHEAPNAVGHFLRQTKEEAMSARQQEPVWFIPMMDGVAQLIEDLGDDFEYLDWEKNEEEEEHYDVEVGVYGEEFRLTFCETGLVIDETVYPMSRETLLRALLFDAACLVSEDYDEDED